MPSTSKFKRLRRTAQAKKALAEIEATDGISMRGDAIQAAALATDAIDQFQDSGDVEHLQNARDLLEQGRTGAVGDADVFFDGAIEELEAVVEDDG